MKKALVPVLLSLTRLAFAVTQPLPFADSFTNAEGNLYTVAAGVWDSAGNAGSELTINSSAALTAPAGLAASAGKGVRWVPGGTARRAGVQFGPVTNTDGNTVYASFLINIQSAPSSGSKLIAFLENSSSSTTSPQLGIFLDSSSRIGIGKKATSAGVNSGALPTGTNLVVVRYTFLASGNDQADLWVNPSAGTFGGDSAPASLGTASGSSDPASLSCFQLNCPSGAGPVLLLDEVRLATNWAGVTPPSAAPVRPLFTSATLTSEGLVVHGSNGVAGGPYTILAFTNLTTSVAQWRVVATNSFDFNGNFVCTNPILSGAACEFYRLGLGILGSPGLVAPYIITQPKSVEAALGQSATFSVNAGGTAPLSYQWFFNTNTVLTGQTNMSISLTGLDTTNFGGYSVLITNAAGAITSSVAMLTLIVPPTNGDYFVSPVGDDANPGTLSLPFFTIAKAVSLAGPGNIIYVRGGSYYPTATIRIDKSGAPGTPTCIWAYPGEQPLLDFTNQPYGADFRGIYMTTNANWWYLRGLEIARAGDNAVKLEGSSNIIERCVFHHNGDTGLQIGFGHTFSNPGYFAACNQVINCDSYMNFDFDNAGSDADGFACKLHPGFGNVFSGCRAWYNADDGWDLFESDHDVVITNCWQWHSGDKSQYDAIYLAKVGHAMSSFQGNGNGFKLGGNGAGGSSMGTHRVYNCVAFNNNASGRTAHGFDQNSHHDGVVLYNCVGFANLYNYFFEDAANSGKSMLFRNNVSFAPSGSTSGVSTFGSGTIEDHNSWDLAVIASSADFVTLLESAASAPRNADGSLPDNGFARLVSGSDLIDKGIDVGIPYLGAAPDLGAFESSP